MKVRTAKVESNGANKTFQGDKTSAYQFAPGAVEFVNKFFGMLKECGYDLLELAVIGSTPLVTVNEEEGTVNWEPVLPNVSASAGNTVILYKTTHSIPGDSEFYLRCEFVWTRGFINMVISYVNEPNPSVVPTKQSYRMPILIVNTPNQYTSATHMSKYLITVSDIGWSIHHDYRETSNGKYSTAIFYGERTFSISSPESVGYTIGCIGEGLGKSVSAMMGSGSNSSGNYISNSYEEVLSALNETAPFADVSSASAAAMYPGTHSASYTFLKDGRKLFSDLTCIAAIKGRTGDYFMPRMMYYASTGERVFVPNGPMPVASEFIGQKLKMVTVISKNAASAYGERFTVIELSPEGVANIPLEYTVVENRAIGEYVYSNGDLRTAILNTDRG